MCGLQGQRVAKQSSNCYSVRAYKVCQPSRSPHAYVESFAVLQIYAAFFLPVFLGFTIGFNLIAWQRARIDRPVVFSFDRRTHLHLHEYFELPTFLLMTLALCLYLSFSIFHPNFPPQLWPMVWLWSTLAFFLNPFPIFHYPARWWLVRSLCRVVMSGLIEVEVSCSKFGRLESILIRHHASATTVPRLFLGRPAMLDLLFNIQHVP